MVVVGGGTEPAGTEPVDQVDGIELVDSTSVVLFGYLVIHSVCIEPEFVTTVGTMMGTVTGEAVVADVTLGVFSAPGPVALWPLNDVVLLVADAVFKDEGEVPAVFGGAGVFVAEGLVGESAGLLLVGPVEVVVPVFDVPGVAVVICDCCVPPVPDPDVPELGRFHVESNCVGVAAPSYGGVEGSST